MFTDEGFYIHNARNVALFGHARTDEFNNMLLSPWLHYVQIGVFQIFGTGSIPARLISVVFSVLTLWIFWAAMRRAFGDRIALTATLFLGLDHTNLLFNRMALMDTPASLPAVAAFYCFVRASRLKLDNRKLKVESFSWLFGCGMLLGLAVTGRSLCAYILPAPFIAIWLSRANNSNGKLAIARTLPALAGLISVGATYFLFWYLPNSDELSFMLHQYRVQQIQPHSISHLVQNIYHSILGDQRGLFPYLFRHTPVLFTLTLLSLGASLIRPAHRPSDRKSEYEGEDVDEHDSPPHPLTPLPPQLFLTAWLLLGWLTLSVISYSPSRYYVSTYPAMAALAGISLWRLPSAIRMLCGRGGAATAARACLIWLLSFHLLESFLHRDAIFDREITSLLLYGVPSVLAFLLSLPGPMSRRAKLFPRHRIALISGWTAINLCWLVHWTFTMDYSQYSASRWLAGNLPAGSVLIGDPAPGICLENRFVAVNVIRHLCNTRMPLEQFAGSPRFVAVIPDSPLKSQYWDVRYPGLLVAPNRLATLRVLRWNIEVYRVPEGQWLQ